jgi:cell division protein FtsQ
MVVVREAAVDTGGRATRPVSSVAPQRRRATRARGGRIAIGIAVAVLFVVGAVGALLGPILALRRIQVVVRPASVRPDPGAPSSIELARQSGLSLGTPLIEVCGSCAATRLDRLPEVRSATVRRRWPNGAVVEVVLRTPVAAVTVGRDWALVDRAGRVLAVVASPPANVVPIEGSALQHLPAPGVAPGAGLRWGAAVAAALPSSVRAAVAAVDVEAGGQVTLRLEEGTRVELGRPGALAAKMEAVATVLARVPLSGVATVDVTVPSAPVVRAA